MEPDTRALIEMLNTRRPARSKSERKFIRKYLYPLDMHIDDYGNLHKRIGTAPVLWSCHTDTVHRKGGHQKIKVQGGNVTLHADADSNCLGADDTAGIWIMREMILNRVEGLYIFHRDEEIGGCGSSYIANETPNALYGIQWAIALDRRGSDSVITHQGWGRCCSNGFARALSDQLRHSFAPDSTGVFTDTANYVDIVPECTNLSVGYDNEHTARESLNLDHVFRLRAALLDLDVSALPVERAAGEKEEEFEDWSDWGGNENDNRHYATEIIRKHPDLAIRLFHAYGLDDNDIIDELEAIGARLSY